MKTINKIFAAALAALPFFASCTEEKIEVGEPENDSYGIYFQTLTTAQKTVVLDPDDETILSFKAYRTKEDDDIVVPIIVTIDDGKATVDDVFVVSEIFFEDGQTEADFTVSFPNAEVGTTYNCKIECKSTDYIKLYSSKPTSITFSVLREKWNLVKPATGKEGKEGIALWRDDFIASSYTSLEKLEWEVEVYENDKTPGLYRFKNVYGAGCLYNEPGDYDDTKDYWTVIDATDPRAVYMTVQRTGCAWSDGEFYIGSLAGYYLSRGTMTKDEIADEGLFGTLVDGVIKFPVKSLLIAETNYNNGALYYANNSGMFRIILPGGKDVDYTLKLAADFCKDSKVPVSFTLGSDIAKVAYKVYEGELDSYSVAMADIVADADAPVVTESGSVDVTCEKTGVYTLVAVGFDAEGKRQAVDGVSFGYVAAGEEEDNATVVTAGMELTSAYGAAGYNKKNSVLFYVYGKNLTDVKLGLYPSDSEDLDDLDALVEDLDSVTDEELASINGNGLSDLFTGLNALTEYTLVVWATNGYTNKIVTAEIETEGLPLKELGTGDYTYTKVFTNSDGSPYLDAGLPLYSDPNVKNTYVVKNWGNGVDFRFTYDPATGEVVVPLQYTGLTSDGVSLYVAEYRSMFKPETEGYDSFPVSTYSAEDHTFKFCLYYIALSSQGVQPVAYGYETFVTEVEFPKAETATTAAVTPLKQIQVSDFSKFAGLDVTPSLKSSDFTSSELRVRTLNLDKMLRRNDSKVFATIEK